MNDMNDDYLTLPAFQRALAARGVRRSYQALLDEVRAGILPALMLADGQGRARYVVTRDQVETYTPRRSRARRVVIDGVEYPSVSDAARALGVARQTIYARLARQEARDADG